ncbi:MAG: hypothetical protein HOE75_01590 [Chloroflexi bacterium]|nr:hypothetical protein [Chloroflexota bacterium]
MTSYGQGPENPPGPDGISGPGGNFQTGQLGRDLQFRLVRDHSSGVANAAWQLPISISLVLGRFWQSFATALHSLPSGLSDDWSYRPDRSTPTPAYEALRGVAAARNVLASGARYVSRLTSSHQRAAFRTNRYLAGKRRPN